MSVFRKAYDAIQLNLGFKRALMTFLSEARDFLDQRVLFPTSALLEQYFVRRIASYYGADYRWGDQWSQNLDLERGNLGYGLLHYALIRNLRPKRVLCVGSMYGFIPYMMARACGENHLGHVDFVDAGFDIADKKHSGNHFFGQGFWQKVSPAKHFAYLNSGRRISTYVITSRTFAKKYHDRYDYIYLDGDHSYRGAASDIARFWPRLNDGGVLGLHDIHFDFKKSLSRVGPEFRLSVGSVKFEMDKVWNKLKVMPYKFEVDNGYSGLGFIQKLGANDPRPVLKSKL